MKTGQGRSFAQAFIKHREFLQAYLKKRGVRPEDAEDLLQEAFVRCCETLRRDPDGEHRRLLVTVVRNLHIDEYRRSRRYSRHVMEGFFDCIPEDSERLRNVVRRALVERLIDGISERPETRFFKMHYQKGYKIQEIAQLTRTSQGTVSSQIFRFRNRLQGALCQQLDAVDEFLA